MHLLAGNLVANKMAPGAAQGLHDQMSDPKYVWISMAAAPMVRLLSSTAIPWFAPADRDFVPVDIYVPGCRRPQKALLYGVDAMCSGKSAASGRLNGDAWDFDHNPLV